MLRFAYRARCVFTRGCRATSLLKRLLYRLTGKPVAPIPTARHCAGRRRIRHQVAWARLFGGIHDVELELAQDDVVWRWRTRVGFTSAPLSYALLGQRACLEFLDAKFLGADHVVELETNRQFPGTDRVPR